MSKAWAGGSTRAQRKIRAAVLLRDGYRCQIATPGTWVVKRTGKIARCLGAADCVHHTKGRARTGDDPQYMQAACTPCNAHTGDPLRSTTTTHTTARNPPMRVSMKW